MAGAKRARRRTSKRSYRPRKNKRRAWERRGGRGELTQGDYGGGGSTEATRCSLDGGGAKRCATAACGAKNRAADEIGRRRRLGTIYGAGLLERHGITGSWQGRTRRRRHSVRLRYGARKEKPLTGGPGLTAGEGSLRGPWLASGWANGLRLGHAMRQKDRR